MKRFLVLVLVVCAGKALWTWSAGAATQALNPAVIEKPVYAQIRTRIEANGRSIDQVALVETVDEGDCKRQTEDILRTLYTTPGPMLTVESKICTAQLEPRFKKLFDRKPAALTYVSVARGLPEEREARIVYWGVTVDESDRVCNQLETLQGVRKGQVTCVRAAR